jgi:hypothetical protein
MKLNFYWIFITLLFILPSCTKKEATITFDLAKEISGNYHILYYSASADGGAITEAAIPIEGAKYQSVLPTRQPTMVYLNASMSQSCLMIYLVPGDKITITGDNNDPLTWDISGNKLDEEWSEWRKKNLTTLRSNDQKKINKCVADYVKKHTDQPLSTTLLLTTYSQRDNETEFNTLWHSLSSNAKDKKLIDAIGRADMLSEPATKHAEIEEFKLHISGDTTIVYNPKKYKASLIYFWRRTDAGRDATIDSLKNIVKTLPDSTKWSICDISLDSEQNLWRQTNERDSIPSAKAPSERLSGWVAGGELAETMEPFDIPRTPYYIVLDTKGSQVFRSGDYNDARKKFLDVLKQKTKAKPKGKTTSAPKKK